MNNNTKSLRFSGITASIDVKKLERETRKLMYLGFIVAVCLHVGAAAFFSFKKTC